MVDCVLHTAACKICKRGNRTIPFYYSQLFNSFLLDFRENPKSFPWPIKPCNIWSWPSLSSLHVTPLSLHNVHWLHSLLAVPRIQCQLIQWRSIEHHLWARCYSKHLGYISEHNKEITFLVEFPAAVGRSTETINIIMNKLHCMSEGDKCIEKKSGGRGQELEQGKKGLVSYDFKSHIRHISPLVFAIAVPLAWLSLQSTQYSYGPLHPLFKCPLKRQHFWMFLSEESVKCMPLFPHCNSLLP